MKNIYTNPKASIVKLNTLDVMSLSNDNKSAPDIGGDRNSVDFD